MSQGNGGSLLIVFDSESTHLERDNIEFDPQTTIGKHGTAFRDWLMELIGDS